MIKTCSKCNQEFPATTEYFVKASRNNSKLGALCKSCNRLRGQNWVKNNKEKHNQRVKNWSYKNPEQAKHIWRKAASKRKALLKGNGHIPYTESEMLDKYGTICYLCNEEIDLKASRSSGAPGYEKSLWKEHVVAITNGGPDMLDNVKPSHAICNQRKGTKEIYENQTA